MSREIKFRAWDKTNKKWLPDYAILINRQGKLCCCYSDKTHGEWAIDYIIVQFTGLLDKNGKEIYEGDIVKLTKSDNLPEKIDVVIFQDDYICCKNSFPVWNKWEVIGNIHENPKLLEVKP